MNGTAKNESKSVAGQMRLSKEDIENSGSSVEMGPLKQTEEHEGGSGFLLNESDPLVGLPQHLMQDDQEHTSVIHYKARRLLYISHLFAQFSEIAFQFCLALFLSAVTHYKSLILVSTYGIAVTSTVVLFGSRFGRYIDATDRLTAARRLIVTENLSVIVATIFCYVLLSNVQPQQDDVHEGDASSSSSSQQQSQEQNWWQTRLVGVPTDAASILALVAIHVFGAVAQVTDKAFLVAMERDWIVALSRSATLSDEDFQFFLSNTNVAMKQIDLCCKVAAPALSALLIPLVSTNDNDIRLACVWIGGANVVSLMAEYICTARVYRMIPELACKDSCAILLDPELTETTTETVLTTPVTKHSSSWLPSGLHIYMQQSSWLGGLGLAMLYTNSLTFGNGIMEGYLLFRGLKLEFVGILRGIAAAIGLLGTFAYHISVKHMSLERTGLWSIVFECTCLALALVSMGIVNNAIALGLLITGVSLSRIGLWVFDIAITQLQQQEIPEHIRGQVGGVQQSLNAGFNLLAFCVGILFPDPSDFGIYVFAAFASVSVAMLLFLFGVYVPRTVSKDSRLTSPIS